MTATTDKKATTMTTTQNTATQNIDLSHWSDRQLRSQAIYRGQLVADGVEGVFRQDGERVLLAAIKAEVARRRSA